MDHKVSKDMISSGMIPSGEKTQADLGRTQYGSAPSPSSLMDAYKSMYDKKEEVIDEMVGKGMGMTPAPKPQGITPAKRVEKSNLPKPQDPATSKPQKDFIKARTSDSPSPKTETPKTDSRMDQVIKHGFAKSYRRIGPKSETEDMQDRLTDRKIERKVDKDMKRDRLKKIMADNESVDLLAAYHSIYEHHKKDADGNTIPHEGEELNEGKIPAGLQAYLDKKKGKKEDKKEVKEGYGAAAKLALNLVKNISKNKVAQNIGRGAAAQFGASAVSNAMSGNQKQQKPTGGTVSASADLFDIVKGQLLDEGLSEEEIRDIMLTLTPDEILKEIEESSLSAGSGTGTGDDMRSDGGDGVFRTKTQVANMFNKNIPAKRNGKVDKFTRKAVNTSARDMGIQGPTTLKQSVEPEGETI